jgi:Xaa-Pro aminopeptidase
MRRVLNGVLFSFAACLILAAVPAAAWERENLSAFHERRAKLLREMGGDGVIVMFGYGDAEVASSTTMFRQDETFYYLTGWNEPGALILVVPKAAKAGSAAVEIDKEILFIPPHDDRPGSYHGELWEGPKLGPDDADAASRTGFPAVKSITLFQSELDEVMKGFSKIYTEATPQPESGEDSFIQDMQSRLKKMAPLAILADFRPAVTRLRTVKSPGEIALIRKAAEASVEAHLAAMKTVKPGMWEYEVAARMQYEYQRRGCEWPAYPPIVGAGFYSTVLHYDQNSRQMADGDVVVMDVAGSYGGYASDITRTLPVNGKFTARQREIYQIVLAAADAAIAAAKPGMYLGRRGAKGLHEIAYEYINTHGKDLKGQPLGQYFIHGLSHSVGLNVHDPFEYNQPLQPGMVVTIEPGVYIREEKLGIRVEDDILITENGCEVLTRRLPRTVEDIERAMAQR